MAIPGRVTLLAGPRHRLVAGGGKLWIIEELHISDREVMAVVLGLGAVVLVAGVVVAGAAVMAPSSTVLLTIARLVLGIVVAAGGLATMLYGARGHGAFARAADDWDASAVLAEVDPATGVLVDRAGGRFALGQVQTVVRKCEGPQFPDDEPQWWVAVLWPGHAVDIAPFIETLIVSRSSVAASRIARTLHAYGLGLLELRE